MSPKCSPHCGRSAIASPEHAQHCGRRAISVGGRWNRECNTRLRQEDDVHRKTSPRALLQYVAFHPRRQLQSKCRNFHEFVVKRHRTVETSRCCAKVCTAPQREPWNRSDCPAWTPILTECKNLFLLPRSLTKNKTKLTRQFGIF